jgi:NAD-dependent SIR2 family protein deacetylase
MSTPNKALLTIRDTNLNAEVLWGAGVALNSERTMFRDADGAWWPMAWSSHEQRYESAIAHVDAILRRATVASEVTP